MTHTEILNRVLSALPDSPKIQNVEFGHPNYESSLFFQYWGKTFMVTENLSVWVINSELQGTGLETSLMKRLLEISR